MEQEYILSGYCRCLDGARMVEVIVENGRIIELDCSYPGCPHAAACPIGENIRQIEATGAL